MKFYVKPRKEPEDELMHYGRKGQKAGVHKFGRWQSQAVYANGQQDPYTERLKGRKVNITGVGLGAHKREPISGGGGGDIEEMAGDPDNIAYDEDGKPVNMALEEAVMKDPAKRRHEMQKLIGYIDAGPGIGKMSRENLKNLAVLAGIMKYGNADELRSLYNKDTARLKRDSAERAKSGKMEK